MKKKGKDGNTDAGSQFSNVQESYIECYYKSYIEKQEERIASLDREIGRLNYRIANREAMDKKEKSEKTSKSIKKPRDFRGFVTFRYFDIL